MDGHVAPKIPTMKVYQLPIEFEDSEAIYLAP